MTEQITQVNTPGPITPIRFTFPITWEIAVRMGVPEHQIKKDILREVRVHLLACGHFNIELVYEGDPDDIPTECPCGGCGAIAVNIIRKIAMEDIIGDGEIEEDKFGKTKH